MIKKRELMPDIKKTLLGRIKAEVPPHPGVYLFKDGRGDIIYIGKSIKLKHRMSSYFQNSKTAFEDRIHRMIYNIRDFNFYETPSELLALLLEDELIKTHLPYFNIRQKEYISYLYLSLTEDTFPIFRTINHSEKSEYRNFFGPFRDHYFIERILEIIRHFFHLRSCKEPVPTRKCMNHDIGFCCGPCREQISKDGYSKIVQEVTDFLEGDETLIIHRLDNAIKKATAAQDFKKAAKLRDQIIFCQSFCERLRFIFQFKTRNLILFDKGVQKMTHIFSKGSGSTHDGHLTQKRIERIRLRKASNPKIREDERHLLDRANILHRWIKTHQKHCAYYFI